MVEEEEEVEDLVSPLVEKKGDSTAPVSLKKTRKRSQVCLQSAVSFIKTQFINFQPKLPDIDHHHNHIH